MKLTQPISWGELILESLSCQNLQESWINIRWATTELTSGSFRSSLGSSNGWKDCQTSVCWQSQRVWPFSFALARSMSTSKLISGWLVNKMPQLRIELILMKICTNAHEILRFQLWTFSERKTLVNECRLPAIVNFRIGFLKLFQGWKHTELRMFEKLSRRLLLLDLLLPYDTGTNATRQLATR